MKSNIKATTNTGKAATTPKTKKKRVFAWQKDKASKKELVDYFPRSNKSGDDTQFNVALVDKGKRFLNKKRNQEKKLTKIKETDDFDQFEFESGKITFGKNSESVESSRVKPPKFRKGDLVLLCIFEIRKDYMVANYTRNIKAIIHRVYSGLDDNESFDKVFKVGDFVAGAVLNESKEFTERKNEFFKKKLLVSIKPDIVNMGLRFGKLVTGMDLWGKLVALKNGRLSADFGISESEAVEKQGRIPGFPHLKMSGNDEEEDAELNEDEENDDADGDDINDYGDENYEDEEGEEEGGEDDDDDEENQEYNDDDENQEFDGENEQEEDEDDDDNDPKSRFAEKKSKKDKNQQIKSKNLNFNRDHVSIEVTENSNDILEAFHLNRYYFFKISSLKVVAKGGENFLKIQVCLNSTQVLPIEKLERQYLRPGFLFNCTVTNELKNGVEVSFGGFNLGGVFVDHQPKGKTFLARVINISKNYISLSGLKHIVKLSIPDINSKLELKGKKYENIHVEQTVFGHSYQVVLDNVKCLLHQSQTGGVKYEPSDIIPDLMIKEYNFFDNKPLLTSKEDIIKGRNITWDSLQVGQFHTVVIQEVYPDKYLIVKINDYINGQLRLAHTDFPSLGHFPSKSKKFRVGEAIQARIFNIDRHTKKIDFTIKKEYLDPNLELRSDIESIKEGEELVVVYLGENFFQHCGNIIGKLITSKKVTYIKFSTYTLKVHQIFKNSGKILFSRTDELLSGMMGAGDFEGLIRTNQILGHIIELLNNTAKTKVIASSTGKVLDFEVYNPKKIKNFLIKKGVDEATLKDNLECLYKNVIIVKPSPNQGSDLKFGFCPLDLVSDFFHKKVFEHFITSEESVTIQMLVLFHDTDRNCYFTTGNKSLIESHLEIPSSLEAIQDSKLYKGYIHKVFSGKKEDSETADTKVSIRFLDKLKVTSRLNKNLDFFTPGQTVFGYFYTNKQGNQSFRLDVYKKYTDVKQVIGEGNSYMKNFIETLSMLIVNNEKYNMIKENNASKATEEYFTKNEGSTQSFTIQEFSEHYISVELSSNPKIKAVLPCNLINFSFEKSSLKDTWKVGSFVTSEIVSYCGVIGKLVLGFPKDFATKVLGGSKTSKLGSVVNKIALGSNVVGKITGVKEPFVYIYLNNKTFGRIHFSNFNNEKLTLEEVKHKFKKDDSKLRRSSVNSQGSVNGTKGNIVNCRIIKITQTGKTKTCDLTTYNVSNEEASGKETMSISKVPDYTGTKPNVGILSKLDLTSKYPITIELGESSLKIKVPFWNLSSLNSIKACNGSLHEVFNVGQYVQFYSKASGDNGGVTYSLTPIKKKESSFKKGDKIVVRVVKSLPGKGYIASLNEEVSGFVDLCEISDDLLANPTSFYEAGTVCVARILDYDESINKFILSLRNSYTSDEYYRVLTTGSVLEVHNKFSHFEAKADYRHKISKNGADKIVKPNLVTIGYVTSSSEKGVFVKLDRNTTARVSNAEITDDNVSKPYLLFKPNQLVLMRVITVLMKSETEVDKINASLRESVVKHSITMKIKDLVVNNFYHCMILSEDGKKYNVNIVGSTFTGTLKKKSNMSKIDLATKPIVVLQLVEFDRNVKPFVINFSNEGFEEKEIDQNLIINRVSNDYLEKAAVYSQLYDNVIQTNLEAKEADMNHELKALEEDMKDVDLEEYVEVTHFKENEKEEEEGEEGEDAEDENSEDAEDIEGGEEEELEEIEDDDEDEEGGDLLYDYNNKAAFINKEKLKHSNGKQEEEEVIENEENDEMEIEMGDESKKLTSSKKREKHKLREEETIRNIENADNQDYLTNPKSVSDFEKLIFTDMNNSSSWIRYAAYNLDNFGVKSSREIFERAIKSIDITFQKEKLNIWISYINLEYTYGNNDHFKNVIERAIEVNEKKDIYKNLIRIYTNSKQYDLAHEIYMLSIKNYFADIQLWKDFLEFLYTAQQNNHITNELEKEEFTKPKQGLEYCLKKLPKAKHLDILVKNAQLLFKFNFLEEARGTFEAILKEHPKRSDIWLVYVDKEYKHGGFERVKHIFEKMFTIEFKPKAFEAIKKKFEEIKEDFKKSHTKFVNINDMKID